MIIERIYLSAVVNELYLRGIREITIKYPPIGTLFKASLKDNIFIKPISENEYAEKKNSLVRKVSENVIREIPSPSGYRMVLYSSNVLKMDNYSELVSELKKLVQRDLLKGNRPLYIGYDTNAMRHRIPTIVSDILKNIKKANVGYILFTGIKNELQPLWDKKFKQDLVLSLKRELKVPEFDEFFNQPPLAARLHKIGAVEYRKVKAMYYAYEIECDKGDENIKESCINYSKENNVEILFLSEDSNFVESLREHSIYAFHIKQPKTIEDSIETDWEGFINLILVSALVFGYITINGIKLFGIWAGKNGDNWNSESLKIDVMSETLKREIERDMKILKII